MTIYFLQNEAGDIKIGYTGAKTADDRIRSLQTGNSRPLQLLAIVPGDEKTERALHRQFRGAHLQGEWFCCSQDLSSLIGFAKTFGRLDGWSRDEGTIAAHATREANRAGVSGVADDLWQIVKRTHSARPQRVSTDLGGILDQEWDPVAIPAHRYVMHVVSSRKSGFCQESAWVERENGYNERSRGITATAEALADASHNSHAVAAVWIQAAIRQCVGRHDITRCIDELFPESTWLLKQSYSLAPVNYHRLVSSPLPLWLPLPERAVITVSEFVRHVALVQAATVVRYLVVADYLVGWSQATKSRRWAA